MLKALDIMTKEVATIRASAKVADAMPQMNQRGVRSLMVMPRHHHDAYGIVTEYRSRQSFNSYHRVWVSAIS
ncbi:MAG TPA: CBS domain-containing protein [Crinalium sp.]|jgi:predicted transcriptional regulator